MFLYSKLKWKPSDNILFMITSIGQNQLHLIVEKLTMPFPKLKDMLMSNNIIIGVGITYMEEALFPREYGMEVTRHGTPSHMGYKCVLFFFL
jgi:hypothetical protein